MSPTDQPERNPDREALVDELHDRIAASRETVRQTGLLFALAQCEVAPAANDNKASKPPR